MNMHPLTAQGWGSAPLNGALDYLGAAYYARPVGTVPTSVPNPP